MLASIVMIVALLAAQQAQVPSRPGSASAPASRPASSQPATSQPAARIRIYKPGDTVTVDGISYAIDGCDYRHRPIGPATTKRMTSANKSAKAEVDEDFKPGTPLYVVLQLFVINTGSGAAKLLTGTIPLEDTNRNTYRPEPVWSQQTEHVRPGGSQRVRLTYHLPGMRQLRLCLTASDGTKHLLVLPPPKREGTPAVRAVP